MKKLYIYLAVCGLTALTYGALMADAQCIAGPDYARINYRREAGVFRPSFLFSLGHIRFGMVDRI